MAANVAWTAKSSASWLTVSTASGSGNGNLEYVEYNVAANSATNTRTATITVTGGGLTYTFTATQSGAAAALTLETTSQGFPAAAASGQKLAVAANVAWTAKSSASWLTISTASGSGNGNLEYVEYSVAANSATNTRTATITVTGGGLSKTFTVTQAGSAARLELEAASQDFTADAASGQSLSVTANVAWTAKSSASWLTASTASGRDNGTIAYSLAANTATNVRTGTITVSGEGLSRMFTVTQAGAAARLELGTASQSFTAAAANGKSLAVVANVPWTAQSSAAWLSLATACGSGDGTIAYAVEANTATNTRTATISVIGGGLARTFTVTQSGAAPVLELEPASRNFTASAAAEQPLAVTGNVEWTAKSGATWLTLQTASGSGNGTLVYDVAENTDAEERLGIITVTGGGLTRIFLAMQAGRTEAQPAPIEVPHQWLEENAADILAANGGDAEAAAAAEAANGRPVWECYVAGLSTTNATANFQVSSFDIVDGAPVVEWSPELPPEEADKRRYTTYGKVSLSDPDWTPVDGDASAFNFFRVTVEMK